MGLGKHVDDTLLVQKDSRAQEKQCGKKKRSTRSCEGRKTHLDVEDVWCNKIIVLLVIV